MRNSEFIEILKEELEMEEVEMTIDTVLKELEGYDSLAVMSIIALADEHFSKKLTGEKLKAITTVRSLQELIGIENFES